MKQERKKALVIVDVQSAFVNKRNAYIIKQIVKLIKEQNYDLYVESVFHADKGSLWDNQTGWICPKNKETITLQVIKEALGQLPVLSLTKQTKSIFKGTPNVLKELKKKNIAELHFVGLDTNDCILASAYEAFDLGFFSYVIEECCESSSSLELHKKALDLLRHQVMTKTFK